MQQSHASSSHRLHGLLAVVQTIVVVIVIIIIIIILIIIIINIIITTTIAQAILTPDEFARTILVPLDRLWPACRSIAAHIALHCRGLPFGMALGHLSMRCLTYAWRADVQPLAD